MSVYTGKKYIYILKFSVIDVIVHYSIVISCGNLQGTHCTASDQHYSKLASNLSLYCETTQHIFLILLVICLVYVLVHKLLDEEITWI